MRDGTVVQIPARELVVGDVILLEAGDMIPADGRLIENASLKIDESALTGESLAVEKNMDTILTEAPLGDRANMLFSGSFVTYGRGKAVVTDIGMQTEVGKIAGLLKSTSEKQTPLQVSLEVFGKKLSIMILVFCGLLFAINVFRGEKISSAFMFAVALAVAAIPEALSSIVTIVLSFGTQKMAKEHAIIRKLQAVEGLGSVSIICSDKTGTLTQNKMTVEDYYIDGKRISAEAIDISDQAQKCLLNYSILVQGTTYYYKVRAYKDLSNGIRMYGPWSAVKAKAAAHEIMGTSSVTVDQMVSYYNKRYTFPADTYRDKGADSAEAFFKILKEEAEAEGVRADVLFAQVMLETGGLKFGGDVQPSQCNFGGLGAVGGGAAGETFADVRTGLRAQVQHLKAYASTDGLNNACVDKRFQYVSRGTARYVEWLAIPQNPYGKGWAADADYGTKLLRIMDSL